MNRNAPGPPESSELAMRLPAPLLALALLAALLVPRPAAAIDDAHWQIASDAIDQGIAYLLETQNEDGSWISEPGPAVTGLALTALLDHPEIDADHPAAAARYADLLRDHPGQVLSQRMQADVANQLMRDARYDDAAGAYELLLATYPSHPEKPHYQLMLGLIYVRYLDRPADAKPLLEKAAERLDGGERDTAQQLLDALA